MGCLLGNGKVLGRAEEMGEALGEELDEEWDGKSVYLLGV